MSSSSKTYTSLTFSSLMEKEVVVPKAWLFTAASNAGNMGGFNNQWYSVKKNYRNRYIYKHMKKKLGIRVSGQGTKQTVIVPALEAYLQQRFPDYAGLLNSSIEFPSLIANAQIFLSNLYGSKWNGTAYNDGASLYTIKSVTSSVTNRGTVTFTSSVDLTSCTVTLTNGSSEIVHKNVPCGKGDIALVATYQSSSGTTRVAVIPLDQATGLFTNKPMTFVPLVPIQERGKTARDQADLAGPGIIKDNWEKEAKAVEKFMKEFGIDEEAFYEELAKKEKSGKTKAIDNAFVVLALPPRDPYLMPACGPRVPAEVAQEYPAKMLFHAENVGSDSYNIPCGPASVKGSSSWWLEKHNVKRKKFAKMFYDLIKFYGNGTTNMLFSTLQTTITIKSTSKMIAGKFLNHDGRLARKGMAYFSQEPPVATTTTTSSNNSAIDGIIDINSGNKGSIVVRKQLTDTHYEEIVITDLTERIKLSGEQHTLYIDGSWKSSADKDNSGGKGELYPQLWYPEELYDSLDFTSAIIAREYGTQFLLFAKQVVKTNWFKVIIGIIIIVVGCYVSGGSLCGQLVSTIGTAMFGAAAGTAAAIFVSTVVYAVAMTAVMMVAQEMISNIDSPWARAVATITLTIVMAALGGGGYDALMTPELFLPLAAQSTTILYNAYIEIQMQDLGEQRRLQQYHENIQEKQEMEGEGAQLSKADTSSHYSHLQAHSPDAMYAEMNSLTNFDQFYAASEVLEARVKVEPA